MEHGSGFTYENFDTNRVDPYNKNEIQPSNLAIHEPYKLP